MDAIVNPAALVAAPAHGIQLGQVVRALRRNLSVIVLLAIAGAIAAYAYARTLPKSYSAASLIAVEGDRFAIPELQGALSAQGSGDPLPIVRTEMQALTSRDLVLVVIDKLKMADLPEFNSNLRPPTVFQQVKSAFQSLLPASSEPPRAAASPLEGVLYAVTRQIKIFQDNRSLAIDVAFTSQDPQLSADVVNGLIAEYVSARAKRRTEVNEGANQAITERVEQLRQELAALEARMRDLRNSNEMVMLRAGSVGQQQLEELATAAGRATVDRAQLETTYDRASALAKRGASGELANVLGSPTVSGLRAQESAAAQRVAELSAHYGPAHPSVRSAQAELDSVRGQLGGETQRIVASLGSQLNVARAHEADMKAQLDEARKSAVKGEDARAQLAQLEQEVTTRHALYQTLLERAQQTVNQPATSEAPDVRVLSTAAPPASPSSPNMKIAGAMGGLAGTLLGSVIALVRVRRFDGVDATDDPALGLPIAAALPAEPGGRGTGGLAARVAAAPHGAEAQALRALRAAVSRMGRSAIPRTLMMCPGGDGDAAGQVAAGLARVAVSDGARVLLIEADLNRPAVATILGFADADLISVLHGEDWRDALGDDDAPLHLLAPVRPSPEASSLLAGVGFQNVLVEAAHDFDLVIIIAPPAAMPDAATLARRADVTLVALEAKPRRPVSRGVVDRLAASAAGPLAAVILGG